MDADELTIEQHVAVVYLLDVAEGDGISTVAVDDVSDLPDGAVLVQLTQEDESGARAHLAYEIARDGSYRQLSPQQKSLWPTSSQKDWRGQDTEPFAGVWYPFTQPTDPEWLELRGRLGRDPLDPLAALEPTLDAIAPDQELESGAEEAPLDAGQGQPGA